MKCVEHMNTGMFVDNRSPWVKLSILSSVSCDIRTTYTSQSRRHFGGVKNIDLDLNNRGIQYVSEAMPKKREVKTIAREYVHCKMRKTQAN